MVDAVILADLVGEGVVITLVVYSLKVSTNTRERVARLEGRLETLEALLHEHEEEKRKR